MKRKVVLASSFLVLLAILLSGVFSLVAADVVGSVKFDPDYIDLAAPAPSTVSGTIRFPSGNGPTVKDINPSTIMLEGTLPPDSTYLIPGGLVAVFDGEMVVNIITFKMDHGGYAPPFKMWLTITGNLYDGTPFSATGYIKVSAPHSPPPP